MAIFNSYVSHYQRVESTYYASLKPSVPIGPQQPRSCWPRTGAMANRTDPDADTVHGANPQFLVDRIVRVKIYNAARPTSRDIKVHQGVPQWLLWLMHVNAPDVNSGSIIYHYIEVVGAPWGTRIWFLLSFQEIPRKKYLATRIPKK